MTVDPEQSVVVDARQAALATLRDYAHWFSQRDALVAAAQRAGASYNQIIEASGLSRGTVHSILTRAGLVNQPPPEDPMAASPSTPQGMSARFFPHHPHFVRKDTSRNRYEFRAFTGDEPEPKFTEYVAWVDEHGDAEARARYEEYYERDSEFNAARSLWAKARYVRTVTPLVEAAVKARPPVDAALDALTAAWSALDTATVWPAAVKRVLEAQNKADTELSRWVFDYARPVAEVNSTHDCSDWDTIATKVNGGQRVSWDVGYCNEYHGETRSCVPPRELETLERTIREQKAQLAEIGRYSGAREHT